MTRTEAVVGAEAVAGRKLSEAEMRRVATIAGRGLDEETTWKQIFDQLDVKTTTIVMHAMIMQLKAAGGDYRATQNAVVDDAQLRLKRMGL